MARGQEGFTFTSTPNANSPAFLLRGGLYQFSVVATWGGGSAALYMLGPDGSTYLSVSTSLTANGGWVGYLPQGQYQIQVVTATAITAQVRRIMEE